MSITDRWRLRHPTSAACEMKVESATSPSLRYEGKTYYFCNDSCAKAFDQEPAEYAVGAGLSM